MIRKDKIKKNPSQVIKILEIRGTFHQGNVWETKKRDVQKNSLLSMEFKCSLHYCILHSQHGMVLFLYCKL